MTERYAIPRNEPCPEDFEAVFLKGGWRAIERTFGRHNRVLMRWYRECGGHELSKRRAEFRNASVAPRQTVKAGDEA